MERDGPEIREGKPVTAERPLERREIESCEALRVLPGDIVVCRVREHLRSAVAKHIRELLERQFPEQQVLVLDGGASLEVYRPTDVDSPNEKE